MEKNIPNKRIHITGKVRTIYSLYYANMSTAVQFTTTAKGRPLMVLDAYSYIRDCQTDDKTYWRCENHKSSFVIIKYTLVILRLMQHMQTF